MTFQELILSLQSYWADQGCIIMQPYDMKLGAGTFHPSTFLASLGPEPIRAAHVQPSRRPTDGRYGDNPNRLQHYFQFQVILKPSPVNFQDIYLSSLKYLNIDPLIVDIRFVENNWESPTLGACGIGWEVWINGMEVTQFTYFQQVGGMDCKPVTGEITYGLERIALHLQNVDDIFDIVWHNSELGCYTYRDMYYQNEIEQSMYNFEYADVNHLFLQFDQSEKMCQFLLKKELSLPAYEQVLTASHVFNLLDARHSISVTERSRYISRVRILAKGVAKTYYENRKKLGFPKLFDLIKKKKNT